jgi:hypothetical protein
VAFGAESGGIDRDIDAGLQAAIGTNPAFQSGIERQIIRHDFLL